MTSMDQYGPDRPCQRTACVAANAERHPGVTVGDHHGGAHLDPRDREHFDGNGTALRAASIYVRDDLYALDRLKSTLTFTTPGEQERVCEVIDVAIHSALKRIDFHQNQATHAQVDADRKVADASRRALDCGAHGERIAELKRQLDHFEAAERRANNGRLALLGFLTAVDDLVEAWRVAGEIGGERPSAQAIVDGLAKAAKRTHAAHSRAWADRSKAKGKGEGKGEEGR